MILGTQQSLTQADLSQKQCEHSLCQEQEHDHLLVLKPRCHPKYSMSIIYNNLTGVLAANCAYCGKNVARFLVASNP